jgi:hypothetical protein
MSSKNPQHVARKRALFRLIDSFDKKNIALALELVKSDRSLYQAARNRYYPMLRVLDPHLGQGLNLLYRIVNDITWNDNGWRSNYTAQYANVEDWEMVHWAIDRFPHSVRTVCSVKLLSFMLSQELPEKAFVWDVLVPNDKTPVVVPDPAHGAIRFRSMQRLEVATGQQLEAIISILPERSDLQTVVAKGCQLASLPQGLVRPMNLSHLDLSQNQFEEIPELLRLASRLQTLTLRDNRLQQLPDWLPRLQDLTMLDLTGNVLKALPPGFLANSKIKKLDLQGNRIQDLGLQTGEENVFLEELNLSFNPLEKFPLELLALKSLKKLSLRNCGLTSLPPELADFHWLERLDVSDNPLQESPAKKVKLQRSLPMILNF